MSGSAQKAEFKAHTGEKLAAALEIPSGKPKAFALFAHCFSCSKDIKAAREIARALRARGFAVLRFDFTGLGASEGDFANTNFSSNVEDLIAAADFLRNEFEAPSILIGHSLGGAAAISAAGKIPEVKGVVTIGAPSAADHVVHQLGDKRAEIEAKGVAEVRLAGRPFTIKKQFIDDLTSQHVSDAAAQLDRPLLVLHAPFDQTVGIENASALFQAAKHPKSFVSLDQADHLLSKTEDAQYAADVIASWATRYLSNTADDLAQPSSANTDTFAAPKAPAGGSAARLVRSDGYATQVSMDGFAFTIDASKAEGGHDLGPNPTRVVEAALAACGVMTMKMYANRKGWALDDVQVSIEKATGEDAHAARILEKEITIGGDLDDAQRTRLAEFADKCPVHKMLAEEVVIRKKGS